MRLDEVAKIIGRLRYKPSWTFRVDDSGDVVVSARVRDAYSRASRRVTVYAYAVANRRMTEAALLRDIFDAVEALESHEAREWFRYGGTRPFDPHA